MPVLQVQDEFQSGDNVTATSLNDLVNEASFVSGAVDNSTLQVASAGHLKVKDNGILSNHLKSDASNDSVRAVTTNHIRNDAVTNAKIANLAVDTDQIAADAVTYAKIQNVSTTNRVLGRDSAGAGNVEEITPAALRTMINVEDGATADQTASEIKTAYESNNDTNVFTDAEKSKLTGIEAGATADQTASEIKTAYESNSNTNAFTDAEKNKLTGIEAGAEVNVQSDWNASSGDAFIKNKPSIPTNNNQLTNGAGYTTNTGTVTSVSGSGGISGTVTTSGSLSLSNSGVTAGTYTNANVTVDATGRVTSASSGSSLSTYNSGYFFDPFFTTGNGGLFPSTTYNFAHGFSHTNFIVIVYVARTNGGLSETVLGSTGATVGIDSTNIKVVTGSAYFDPHTGATRNFATGNNSGFPNWAWLRVLAIAL
jgi:hypothetical protein